MLAACKAAFSGLSQSANGISIGGGGRNSPSEKQVEAFIRSISDGNLDEIAAHINESRTLLLVPLKVHPARSSAWHLAAVARTARGHHTGSSELLQLLIRLYSELELPHEGLPDVINATNKRGQTCLHSAAAQGNCAAVRLLLSLGCCDWLRADNSGRTALHHAAAAGSEESIRLLLTAAESAAAAPSSPGVDATALMAALKGKDSGLQTLQAMMPRTSSLPPPAPSTPGSTSHQDQQANLLQQQQQQQPTSRFVSSLVSAADAAGLTPLHFAVATKSLPIVRMLLAAGASYTAQATADNLEASMPCNAGWSCLHVAAMRGHFDAAMLVLRFHASLSTEEQVARWTPGKHSRSCDPRALLDRRGTPAYTVALTRGFADLAVLLNPLTTTLSHTISDGLPVGPDGEELRPPAMFVCPITQEVMRDPVVASDGFTYERAAICRWLSAGKQTSPMTNLPLAAKNLYPNHVMKSAIKEWRQENKLPDIDAIPRNARRPIVFDSKNAKGHVNGLGGGGGRDPFLLHLRTHGL